MKETVFQRMRRWPLMYAYDEHPVLKAFWLTHAPGLDQVFFNLGVVVSTDLRTKVGNGS